MGLKVLGRPRKSSFPLKYSPPKMSIKLSPQKTYHFKILQPPKIRGGGDSYLPRNVRK